MRSNGLLTIVLIELFILILFVSGLTMDEPLKRSRRQLLYPNSTVLQVNAGVGTPTPVKTINVNWAFQANFQLPWNRSQIPFDAFRANEYVTAQKRDTEFGRYESDAKLYHFYKYVEDVLNGYSYNGTACVLRTLCQLGAEPLHSDYEEDLLHELASFVLNPENDILENEVKEAVPYVEAYNMGKRQKNCELHTCPISLIDMFSSNFN